jgi:hypothetical protein
MLKQARSISHLVLITAFVVSAASLSAVAQEPGLIVPDVLAAKDPTITYRLDLMTNKLDPIDRRDLRVGYVYYHFSSRLNGWAWSYYGNDHDFWFAYGEGTVQNAWCFDIRASREDIAKRLKEFTDLAQQVDRYNESVCLRLQADGRWKIIGIGRVPTIFNAETGELWQMFYQDKYIPVVHASGKIWVSQNGTIHPSNSSFLGR